MAVSVVNHSRIDSVRGYADLQQIGKVLIVVSYERRFWPRASSQILEET